MAIDSGFWSGKRVLITGHTGFKGSWLSLWLQSMGAELSGYSLSVPSSPALFEIASVATGMTSILGDIRDLPKLQQALTQYQPDIVIHMAAQSLVRYSYQQPVETYSTNVMGTVNLLEAIRHTASVKSVVIVTSDKCYENREWEWGYRENEALGGHDPYSSSKACAELVSASYRQAYFPAHEYHRHGVAIASCRAGNVIGGGDWAADRLIPDIMRAISQNEPLSIRNPGSIRPWQHVLEPLSGYLLLAQKLFEDGVKYAQAWNFGPHNQDAQAVSNIVHTIVNHWGKGSEHLLDAHKFGKPDEPAQSNTVPESKEARLPHGHDVIAQPHEAHYLKLDCSKANMHLLWQPKWKLDQALQQVCSWHKAYLAGETMRAVCLDQIGQYESVKN